ncbi:beta strand repeat-containing protein [Hymenobacter ruricola]|uniref:T9SS type A sorting domain-containing protein n=1 Tax=Hymenobacter ruricola TaxID=2791023 RepID=A0ABS0I1T0_9BACT|nr:GEVED domain-containing protein [Hymenobacter ruricola]MBF9220908.1 T9SS type A sorting domain-containing protein [Hymenobacter ruricola]
MKKPFTRYSRLLLLALAGAFARPAAAQTYTPVALTGYNHDVIAEGTGPTTAMTTYDVDGAVGTGYVFASASYVNPAGETPAGKGIVNPLPNSGLITSIASATTGLTFQLAGYASNNVLRVPATGNTGTGTGAGPGPDQGTLGLASPVAASTVYALVTGGGGPLSSNVNVTLTFTDGTTQAFTGLSISDWFSAGTATAAYRGFGRVGRTATSAIDAASSTTPLLYQLTFAVAAANVNKPISAITFGKTSTATGVINVFAVSVIPTSGVPACSGTPTAGTASSSASSTCPAGYFTLSLTGNTSAAGLTYQWQYSTDNTTWTNLPTTNATGPYSQNANAVTCVVTGQQAASTSYRCQVSCQGSTATSTAVAVTRSPAANCYCTPPARSSSTSTSYASVSAVSLPGDGGVTLSNAPGALTTPFYTLYPTSTTTTALSVNSSYTLSVGVIAFARASAWIDFNQDGAFDASEFFILRTSGGAVYSSSATTLTASIAVPATAVAGPTRLRIRNDYYNNAPLNTPENSCTQTQYGQTMDYTVSITAAPCTGGPTSVTAAASAASTCPGNALTLSVTAGNAGISGLSYQWQSSPAGANTFTNLGTAQASSTYTVPAQTAATDYRVLVSCTSGGATTTSNVVAVAQTPFLNCYCTPTYSNGGVNETITRVRLDVLDNATTGNASPYYRDYASAQTGSAATLQVPTLYAGTPTPLTLNFGSDGNQYNGVWVDFNQNGVFETSEFFTSGTNAGVSGTATVTITIPATAAVVAGQTKMRIRGGDDSQPTSAQACGASNSGYGEAEDYLVNIVATPCAGTPPALTATASATSVCGGSSFTLTATGLAPGTTGVTYQWQRRTGTNAFADIMGATTNPYTVASQTAATDYRVIATCGSGSATTSSVVTVAQNTFLNCYCAPVSTGTNEYVKSVALPGTPGFANATGANSTGGYGDFTADPALTTTLVAGTTYTGSTGVNVTVRSNATNSQGGLWIDYDHSGTFEASEYTLLGTSSLTATDVTFAGVTLAVPATALAGPTRARVRWRNSAFTGADACVSGATAWYGETEDYLVSICLPATAGFSYGSASYCVSGATNPAATLATGATAGTFTSTAGLTLNATTGAITLSSSTPGTYTVTNTVSGSCNAPGTTTVTINAAPTAGFSYGSATYCVSGTTNPTATLASGAAAGTFSSTTGLTLNATTGAITLGSSTPGTYTVTNTVAAANGCAAVTSTTVVTITNAPTASFAFPTATTCAGSTATLTPTLSTGAIAGTFTLPAATGLSVNATTGAVTVGATAAAGTYTVTNTVPAANGCAAATSTATFTLTPQASAAFSYGTGPFCTSGTTVPTPVITGAAGGTFSSATGLTLNATTGAITLASSTPGTYTVTYTVATTATQCGAASTYSVTITAPATAAFSYPTATTCAGSSATLTPTLGTGATAGTFSLPAATGLTVNATTGVVTVGATAPAGTYTVTNTVAASGGCAAVTGTSTFTLTAPATSTFTYPAPAFCLSGIVPPTPTVTGTAGGTFSAAPAGLVLNASTGVINLGSSTAGTYTVTYAVSGTCGSSSTATVTITTAATAGFSYPTPALGTACAGSTGSFTPTLTGVAGTFSVAPAGLTVNATTGAISLTGAPAGTYTITNSVAAGGGCAAVSSTATFTVNARPATPTITATYNGTTTTLTSSTTTGNQWYLGQGAVTGATGQTLVLTGLPAQLGSYTVTTTNATGCTSLPSNPLVVTSAKNSLAGTSLTVYPNPTPDGRLTLELSGYREAVALTVLNALGQRVYEGTVTGNGLTQQQTLNLSALPSGMYTLQARTASGSVEVRRVVRE